MFNSKRVQLALTFATEKHKGQKRIGGNDYISHPLAVYEMVKKQGHGEDFQITALFHDLLEDTDATEEEIAKFPHITYSLQDGSALPKGLELSTDGMITGTPVYECEGYQFTVVASALGYKDRTTTYTISALHGITFEAIELENGRFAEDYLASIAK